MMSLKTHFLLVAMLLALGCTKEQDPWRPFISCKINGVHWETDYYKPDDILGSESPYATTELLQSGYMWTFRGSERKPSGEIISQMVLHFRLSGLSGPADSLLGIFFRPSNADGIYSGDNESCDGELLFESSGRRPKGTFSGKVFISANIQGGPDTLTITDGVFEAR